MSIASPKTNEERKIASALEQGFDAGWDEAIEECAKIAENGHGAIGDAIAAKIRKLGRA